MVCRMLGGITNKRRCAKRLVLACIIVSIVTTLTGTFPLYKAWSTERSSYRDLKNLILKPNFTSSETYDVILSAYMNSGSRFTSRLLGFRPDAFFFYEPLWKFSIWDYFEPPDRSCSTTLGSCRKVNASTINSFQPVLHRPERIPIVGNITSLFRNVRPTDVFLHVISSVYSCNLVHLRYVVQERVQDDIKYAGPSWEGYKSCISMFKPKSYCLRKLEDVCRRRKHRITKVLRATLGTFRPLLLTNPRLKVVHLVRDPRAIIHSRIYSRHYPVYGFRENSSLETNLCDKMMTDYKDGVQLMKEFPERVKILYYEDLITNLNTRLKQVMNFLNMSYNQTEVDLLAKIEVNLSPPEKGNGFVQARRENNSDWWRKYMQQYDIDRVNKACFRTLRVYGYKPLNNALQLRDTNVPSYIIPEELMF